MSAISEYLSSFEPQSMCQHLDGIHSNFKRVNGESLDTWSIQVSKIATNPNQFNLSLTFTTKLFDTASKISQYLSENSLTCGNQITLYQYTSEQVKQIIAYQGGQGLLSQEELRDRYVVEISFNNGTQDDQLFNFKSFLLTVAKSIQFHDEVTPERLTSISDFDPQDRIFSSQYHITSKP